MVVALLSTGGLFATFMGLFFMGISSGGFVVSSGHISSRRAWQRERDCIGVTYEPDWRDGWTTYCIGIPRGRWRCYEQLLEGPEESVEVSCK
jgi:hypothetical protein